MKKESVIVGIFGLSLGLLVAWAIWNFKSAAPQVQELAVSPQPTTTTTTPTPTPAPAVSLTLESPQDEAISTQSSILVSGKAKPGTRIVIATSLDDFVSTATQDGNFSQEINLEEGENVLTITTYTPDKKEETIERSVIYTKEALE